MPRRPPPIRVPLSPEELARARAEEARRDAYWKSGSPLRVVRSDGTQLTYYDHGRFGFVFDDEGGQMNFAREHAWRQVDGLRRFIGLFGESFVEYRHKEGKETPP